MIEQVALLAAVTVVVLACCWGIAHCLHVIEVLRVKDRIRDRKHARAMFKLILGSMDVLFDFHVRHPHMFRPLGRWESSWTWAQELGRHLYPDVKPLDVTLHTWEIRTDRRLEVGFKIWRAKHKEKSDPGDGSYSRVDRETALSGIKKYHWFTKDETNVVHRAACLKHDSTHSFVLLCDETKRVEDVRVSQSEVGKGPTLTCVTCVAVDAP